jgi:molybdopterin-guanine dinucleotide biosynthesis protein A
LVAGADVLGTRSVLLVAVDLPGVPIELLRLLADWPGDETVLPVAAGREQYVCARYGVTALQRARRELAAGARSLHSITSGPDVARVDEGEWTKVARPDAFADVDTPADVARVGLEPPG